MHRADTQQMDKPQLWHHQRLRKCRDGTPVARYLKVDWCQPFVRLLFYSNSSFNAKLLSSPCFFFAAFNIPPVNRAAIKTQCGFVYNNSSKLNKAWCGLETKTMTVSKPVGSFKVLVQLIFK